jgi:hypothetical protein
MKKYKTHNKYAILFRLYSSHKYFDQKKGEITSDIGHSASIACYNDEIRYIDPQQSIDKILEGTMEEQINQAFTIASYNSSFKIIDLIFVYNNNKQIAYSDSEMPTFNKLILEEGINSGNCLIRPRPVDLVYGGINKNNKKKTYKIYKTYKQKGRKIKTKTKTKTVKNIHKNSKNTHEKKYNKKNRNKQYGGYDTFEEVMLDTDKKNGIKSNIILQS